MEGKCRLHCITAGSISVNTYASIPPPPVEKKKMKDKKVPIIGIDFDINTAKMHGHSMSHI